MDNLLITGLPYSGTTYMWKLFKLLGCNAGHEEYGPHMKKCGKKKTLQPIEISWEAFPILNKVPSNIKIIHQVRNPLLVVRRLLGALAMGVAGIQQRLLPYYSKTCNQSLTPPESFEDRIIYVCELYCLWNKHITDYQNIHMRYRIENIDAEIYRIRDLIGANWKDESIKWALNKLSKNTHTKKGIFDMFEQVTFDKLTPELQVYIKILGYSEKDCRLM